MTRDIFVVVSIKIGGACTICVSGGVAWCRVAGASACSVCNPGTFIAYTGLSCKALVFDAVNALGLVERSNVSGIRKG